MSTQAKLWASFEGEHQDKPQAPTPVKTKQFIASLISHQY